MTEQLQAGEVHSTFNEYLRLLIEYGVLGLSLWIILIVFLYRQLFKKLRENAATFISLTSFLIISLFSYPLSSFTVCVIITVIYTMIPWRVGTHSTNGKVKSKRFRLSYILIPCLIFIGFASLRKFQAIREWHGLKTANYQRYNEQLLLIKADKLLPILRNEPRFTHDYARILYNMGFFEKALTITELGSSQFSNLSIHLLKAAIYEEIGKDGAAEMQYEYCIAMVPKAFSARYLLFSLYKEHGENHKAKEVGFAIHSFPEKVYNADVRKIKHEIYKFLTKTD